MTAVQRHASGHARRISGGRGLDVYWASAILFLNGWAFTLPVTEAALPVWFTPVQVAHGIFLHESLLLAYLAYTFAVRGGSLPPPPVGSRWFGGMIGALGGLAILSAAVNGRPIIELVGAGRYFLLAVYFVVATYWTKRHGHPLVLRYLLLGMASGGVVNLYYTFTISEMKLGGLPFLLGQNGPGGLLGISVVLSAWLMMSRTTRFDTFVAVAAGSIGLIGSSISYSKLAMIMAAAGALAWGGVLWSVTTDRRGRGLRLALVIAALSFVLLNRQPVADYARGVDTFIDYKFRHLNPETIGERSQYALITAEILREHPFFGVSYGGFYDAATATKAYASGRAAREDPEAGARRESNPHNSFLYYACANGLGGVLLSGSLYGLALILFWRALSVYGLIGRLIWACLGFSYLVYGSTLPSLFSTSILYLAVATAASSNDLWRGRTRVRRLRPARMSQRSRQWSNQEAARDEAGSRC